MLWTIVPLAVSVLAGCATPRKQEEEAPRSLVRAGLARAAKPFSFTTRASDHENRWIALRPQKGEEAYPFGFVYIDPEAGFTFNLEGKLARDAEGKYTRVPIGIEGKGRVMVRLSAQRNPPAALLTAEVIEQLGLPETPDWLEYYADRSDSITHRVRWGSHYNHVAACQRALTYLEPVYQEKPDAEGIEFELAYAYNELNRPAEAITVLKQGMARHPDDILLGSELAFAYANAGMPDAAVQLYLKLIPRCGENDKLRKSEMAANLASLYSRVGDAPNAKKWIDNAKAWEPPGVEMFTCANQDGSTCAPGEPGCRCVVNQHPQ